MQGYLACVFIASAGALLKVRPYIQHGQESSVTTATAVTCPALLKVCPYLQEYVLEIISL